MAVYVLLLFHEDVDSREESPEDGCKGFGGLIT